MGKIFSVSSHQVILLCFLVSSINYLHVLLGYYIFFKISQEYLDPFRYKNSLPESEFCVSVHFGGRRGGFKEKWSKQALISTGNLNRTFESFYIFCFVFIVEYVLDQIRISFFVYPIAVSCKFTLDWIFILCTMKNGNESLFYSTLNCNS